MIRIWACAAVLVLIAGCAKRQAHYEPGAREAIESGSPLLAVSQTTANRITLISLDPEEREIATIPVACKGPFGLAFSPERSWLYAACWDHSQIALIDLQDQRPAKIFKGAKLPAWIRLRDESDEIWISHEGAGKVTIYHAGTETPLAEIATGVGPSAILFTDHGRKSWVSNETSGNISLLDANERSKIRDIPVGKTPQGMALTSKQDRLLVTNFGSDTVSVIDTVGAREIAQIAVCQGPVDVAAALEGGSELGFVSCFKSGEVAVVDIDQKMEIQRIPVGQKPFGIAAHPSKGRIYVCVGDSNELVVIQAGKPNRIARRMRLPGNPLRIAVAP